MSGAVVVVLSGASPTIQQLSQLIPPIPLKINNLPTAHHTPPRRPLLLTTPHITNTVIELVAHFSNICCVFPLKTIHFLFESLDPIYCQIRFLFACVHFIKLTEVNPSSSILNYDFGFTLLFPRLTIQPGLQHFNRIP